MLWWLVYLAGVVIALSVMRDPWPVRIGTALVWPLGPMAFVLVISILCVSSLILWPLLILPVVVLAGTLGWWLT